VLKSAISKFKDNSVFKILKNNLTYFFLLLKTVYSYFFENGTIGCADLFILQSDLLFNFFLLFYMFFHSLMQKE